MKFFFRFVFILAILGACGWFGYKYWLKNANKGELTLYGNVDIREVNLSFRVSGRVVQVIRDEGDAVKVGDIVARLDAEPYQRQAEQAQAELANAEAELKRIEKGNRPEEIAQTRALLNQRRVELENAQLVAARAEKLFPEKAVSQETLDDARMNRAVAEKQLDSANANNKLLEIGFREEEKEKARATVAQLRAALENARIQVADTTLVAPSPGMIITRAVEPGTMVQAGSTVQTLSLDKPIWIRAYVSESELGKAVPGKEVEVFTDSRPSQPYKGKIGFVSAKAEFTPKTVQTEQLRTSLVYRIRITVSEPDSILRQGMPVTVRINN